MDSPAIAYTDGWTVDATGASPAEPVDPWHTPSGDLTFTYAGRDLALLLAAGDYWGYLYVTVDGQPANLLVVLPGNANSRGEAAGYRTLFAPEAQTPDGPAPAWVEVHRAQDDGPHQVHVEVWRSWGERPIRGIAIDVFAAPASTWPVVALLMVGGWLALAALWTWRRPGFALPRPTSLHILLRRLLAPISRRTVRTAVAVLALLLCATAIAAQIWWLTPIALAVLGYTALAQPSLWLAALLFALPFYYSQTVPLLPNRATNLVDLGLLAGLLIAGVHLWLLADAAPPATADLRLQRTARLLGATLAALVSWALVAAAAAEHTGVALREWRTVFLAAGLMALLLTAVLHRGDSRDQWLLVVAWLGGACVVAVAGLWQFAAGANLIEAEGVMRIRAYYGSPNNLAIYLERTTLTALAFVLLLPNGRARWLALAAALAQGAALLLTFSKGALLLGLPAGLATLWLGGLVMLRHRGASLRPLWWIAGALGVAALFLVPFLGTDRFRRLLDLSQGTGFTRLLLWRSALQMALDHTWTGVGPDNFLYALRSEYLLPAGWQEPNLNHPHNWLLDWWTRLGLPGLLLGSAFFLAGGRLLWLRFWSSLDGPHAAAALWLGLSAAAVAALVHGLIDLSFATPDLMLVWVFMFSLAAAPGPGQGNPEALTPPGS
jgi:O-antigen ligase